LPAEENAVLYHVTNTQLIVAPVGQLWSFCCPLATMRIPGDAARTWMPTNLPADPT
jgi:formate-dependent phosphoribosylglycinamide formyltransferase (GAR transformylase)